MWSVVTTLGYFINACRGCCLYSATIIHVLHLVDVYLYGVRFVGTLTRSGPETP